MNVSLRFVFQREMMLSSFIMKPTNVQTQECFIPHVNYGTYYTFLIQQWNAEELTGLKTLSPSTEVNYIDSTSSTLTTVPNPRLLQVLYRTHNSRVSLCD